MRKTLLLNSSYEPLSFITERKVIKFLIRDKVEVLSSWEEPLYGDLKLPAIIRLKYSVYRNFYSSAFNRPSVVIRDKNTCQYCGKVLSSSQTTIDHILPKDQGGVNSFENCVVSCRRCNSYKRNRTPEQAGMMLLSNPVAPPPYYKIRLPHKSEIWHPDWHDYVRGISWHPSTP